MSPISGSLKRTSQTNKKKIEMAKIIKIRNENKTSLQFNGQLKTY